MSTHPNVILMLVLTPDDLTRKTARAIASDGGCTDLEDAKITIGDEEYDILVMESDYDEGLQISANEGDIVLHDFVTYGYGETIIWDKLSQRVDALRSWAAEACVKYKCRAEVFISANYW